MYHNSGQQADVSVFGVAVLPSVTLLVSGSEGLPLIHHTQVYQGSNHVSEIVVAHPLHILVAHPLRFVVAHPLCDAEDWKGSARGFSEVRLCLLPLPGLRCLW